MKKSVVAGSFSPITLGHIHVIKEALKVSDEVYVIMAKNHTKKEFIPDCMLLNTVLDSLYDSCQADYNRIKVEWLEPDTFVATYAESIGATCIFRGIRNVVDFEYEHALQLINKNVAPNVSTVFVMPPSELVAVSSSMIRGMLSMKGWQTVVAQYVTPSMMSVLESMEGSRK